MTKSMLLIFSLCFNVSTYFYPNHSVLEHVVSNQPQPQAHSERAESEMRLAVLQALSTLPDNEKRAICERLGLGSFSTTTQGTDRGTGTLKYSQMDALSGVDTAMSLYQKGTL
jgi:hypothetical protein